MSAFLVISTSEKLNWIVDGIVECRPQNRNIETFIGTGKLEKRKDGLYYVHSYPAEEKLDTDEGKLTDLQTLFANQFAHFRRIAGIQDNLQVFILDNPIDEESLAYSQEMYQKIDSVINDKYENDCSLIRILFSYNVSVPCDICAQVPENLLQSNIEDAPLKLYTQLCYIDNQNRSNAAISRSVKDHQLIISRMLCDFMMLMSSANSQYNIRNAVSNERHVFSLGYAECMYYYKDVERYFEMAYQYGIRLRMLEDEDEEGASLDYHKYPIGISERVQRLHPIYLDVSFDTTIADYPSSIDKQIDDIIVSLYDSIVAIKQEALAEARKKDQVTTQQRRKESIENGETDVESIQITTEQESVEQKYPDYIDRQRICNLYMVEKTQEETFEDNELCIKARKQYLDLIDFIQTPLFKNFISLQDEVLTAKKTPPQNEHHDKKKGCNVFVRWLMKNTPEENKPMESAQQEDTESIIKKINSVGNWLKQKYAYQSLCEFEEQLKKEIDDYAKKMSGFDLTSHSLSYDSLIDVEKLKQHQQSTSQEHLNKIVQNWKALPTDRRNKESLFTKTKDECTQELSDFTYIHWDNPASFVKKNIDIEKVCRELYKKSIPFVNSLVIRSTQENNTTCTYYTDYDKWQQMVTDKLSTNATLEISEHIASKIAIFQILQWDTAIVEGLTDINKGRTHKF